MVCNCTLKIVFNGWKVVKYKSASSLITRSTTKYATFKDDIVYFN